MISRPARGSSTTIAAVVLAVSASAAAGDTVGERFSPPPGFARLSAPTGSFGAWLRDLPLLPGNPDVRRYDGSPKAFQGGHAAVVDLDVGKRDLQQCADAVIRLRAEYLRDRGCDGAIAFDFTSGDRARWIDWRAGRRPHVDGRRVTWRRDAAPDGSDAAFRAYLETVFTYAGTASLERELDRVADPGAVEPGDVFVQGGSPGHAVIVLDVAADPSGGRVFLLAQSFMPAQQVEVLRGSDGLGPWFRARRTGLLRTPEWTFRYGDLARFPHDPCERGER